MDIREKSSNEKRLIGVSTMVIVNIRCVLIAELAIGVRKLINERLDIEV